MMARAYYGPRGDRLEAARLALPLRSVEGLAQVQEPASASGEAGSGGGVGSLMRVMQRDGVRAIKGARWNGLAAEAHLLH